MRIITKVALGIGVGYGLYLVACNHFIYFGGKEIRLLKKKEPTFSRTFFSATLKEPRVMMSDDVLRNAGIGDLLVKTGRLSKERKEHYMAEFEKEEASQD